MDWTTEQIAELSRLWNQTDPVLTTREIGKRMGISPNAVVGKAHRCLFVGRPSPIRRVGPRPDSQKPKLGRIRRTPVVVSLKPRTPRMTKATALTFTPDPAKTIHSPSIHGRCNWPLWGDMDKADHRYCGHDTEPGSNYCQAHRARGTESKAKTESEAA